MSARIALIVLFLLAGCAARPLVAKKPVAPTNPIDDRSGATTIDSDKMALTGWDRGDLPRQRRHPAARFDTAHRPDRRRARREGRRDRGSGVDRPRPHRHDLWRCRNRRAGRLRGRERPVVARGPARAMWKDGEVADCDSVVIDLSRARTPRLPCRYAAPKSNRLHRRAVELSAHRDQRPRPPWASQLKPMCADSACWSRKRRWIG